MASRHKSRRRALQVLFEWDVRGGPVDEAIAHYYQTLYSGESESEPEPEPDPFMEDLVRGTIDKKAIIDRLIEDRSENWKLNRMPVVDRNILRLAIYEMSLNTLPPVVVIDEAMTLARQFSSDESMPFINGLLDAINKKAGTVALGGSLQDAP